MKQYPRVMALQEMRPLKSAAIGLLAVVFFLCVAGLYGFGALSNFRKSQARLADLARMDRDFQMATGAASRPAALPRSQDQLVERLDVNPDDHDAIEYRLAALDPDPRAGDLVVSLCRSECESADDDVIDLRLAYAIREDRGGGTDTVGYVFAPASDGVFTGDAMRFIYLANPGSGIFDPTDSWGVTEGPWQGGDQVDDALGRLLNFGDTEYASVLKKQAESSDMSWVNGWMGPSTDLVIYSGFAERLTSPGGKQIDQFVRWIAPEGDVNENRLGLAIGAVSLAWVFLRAVSAAAIGIGRRIEKLEP